MGRIEFVKGESNCRFDGVIMTPEACEKLYGYSGEFDILDDTTYCIDGIIYTDKRFGDLLKILGTVRSKADDYDEIVSQGRGFQQHCIELEFQNILIIPLRHLEYWDEIKPFGDFKTDYPNLNVEKYIEFMDCLDKFYEEDKIK